MHWVLGFLCVFVLLLFRRAIFLSPRARVCKPVVAAQQALERRDFAAFDRNLSLAKKLAENLRDEALRAEFRGDLALMTVQGAYWRGDTDGAERAAREAMEILSAIDLKDPKGKLCAAHVFMGDILMDKEEPIPAAEEFRAAADQAQAGPVPFAAIFHLQRLADALLEADKREEAVTVIDRCVELEKDFFAGKHTGEKQPEAISMTAPDQSLVRADFATAEKLFDEKVRFFNSSPSDSSSIDVLRYQLHLAEAQQALGKIDKARTTLTAAWAAAEQQFGPQHPRVARIRRKIESVDQLHP